MRRNRIGPTRTSRPFYKKEKRNRQYISQELTGLPITLHHETGEVRHSYWMYSILLDDPQKRDLLRDYLDNQGIETRPVFYPVHTMPIYSQKFQRHPVAESLGWRGINLPSWPGLDQQQITCVISAVNDFFHL